ncbi:hypothetical protein [Streptomyces sp. NPDC050145]|uniref:hypothetical protein n=1 Tax=Streptomyces sp. NPDC050145 TaxID=3365602 RepID=UPI0037AB5A30
MTDKQPDAEPSGASEPSEPSEHDEVRLLLAAAAEPEVRVSPPGRDFTARARRSLRRRRLAAVTTVTAVCAAVLAGVLVVRASTGEGEPVPAASADCLRGAAERIRDRQEQGYRAVFGTVREGRIRTDDGVTRSSAFRFDVDGALTAAGEAPAHGSVQVWYPAAEVQLPAPGQYLLLLRRADRPGADGAPLFHFAPEQALPVDDGQVRLRCADGRTGSVPQKRLRAAVDGG